MNELLTIEDLHVHFRTPFGEIHAVNAVSLQVRPGERVALVGESGCGKSVTALSVMGLLPKRMTTHSGSIAFHDQQLIDLRESHYRLLRGRDIGMVFQDPMTALNPTMKVGKQVAESLRRNLHLDKAQAHARTLELFQEVGIPTPESRFHHYPHQFSGGQRQRATIAMAIACRPKLIIADEPTTALDVTMQGQMLDLLHRYQDETEAGILLITHDLGVVAGFADRVVVMYAGRIVERGPVDQIFQAPSHPYTRALLESVPHLEQTRKRLPSIAGSPPSLSHPIEGCPFAPRCPNAMKVCLGHRPPPATEEKSACWLHHKEIP